MFRMRVKKTSLSLRCVNRNKKRYRSALHSRARAKYVNKSPTLKMIQTYTPCILSRKLLLADLEPILGALQLNRGLVEIISRSSLLTWPKTEKLPK